MYTIPGSATLIALLYQAGAAFFVGSGADPSALKTSIASSTGAVVYTGTALNGSIGVGTMVPARRVTVTTSAQAGAYLLTPITIKGFDAAGAALTNTVTPTLVNGGETLTTTNYFATVYEIDRPVQSTGAGTFTFGVAAITGSGLVQTLVGLATQLPATLGQKAKTASLAVSLATDEPSAISLASIDTKVSTSNGYLATLASGGGSTSDSTAAKQDTGNTSLASLDTKQPGKGTAVMAGATPVTIATDDTLMAAIKADVDKIPSKGTAVMTGSAPVTIATDDTLMAAIKADVDKIPSRGTAVMTGSMPVTISTDDTVLTGLSGKWPTAAVLADGETASGASATVTRVGSRLEAYNGTTFDLARSGVKTAVTTPTGHLNAISEGVYNSTRPTLTDGQVVTLQLANTRGDLGVTDSFQPLFEDNSLQVAWGTRRFPPAADPVATVTNVNSSAVAASLVGKASPGRFLMCHVENTSGGAAGWVMVFNAASLPSTGGVPIFRKQISAGGQVDIDLSGINGAYCSVGYVVAVSTTQATLTTGAATYTFDIYGT